MISRILFVLLPLVLLPFLYVDLCWLRRRGVGRLYRLLWWIPCLLMLVWTLLLGCSRKFVPSDMGAVNAYLFLLGLVVIPLFLFSLCTAVGGVLGRLFRSRRNYGVAVGLLLVPVLWYVLLWGTFVGPRLLTVRRVTVSSPSLPRAFDGYRLVHFSDLHAGTFDKSRRGYLRRAVDTINALEPDAVMFTGDLQNLKPDEVYPVQGILSRIHARDGVYSVMGNHDYPIYVQASVVDKEYYLEKLKAVEHDLGWNLLDNSHLKIRRGADSIVVAGMENDGDGRHFPQRGDVPSTLSGLGMDSYIIMLQHDPTAWRRKILPQCGAQLTLSGHTHAMQFELFGWSPASLFFREWGGVYTMPDGRALNVSTGLGGFLPFRFGVPGEIVVITLRRGVPKAS